MSKVFNICGGKKCCPQLIIEEKGENPVKITDDFQGKARMTKEQAKQLAETILKEVE